MGFFSRKKKNVTTIKLQGFPSDINTCKCLLLAAEKKVKIEIEVLDIQSGACDEAAYRQGSPFGYFPALVDGDFSVTSVNAVLSYLDVKGAGNSLLNPKKAQFFGHQNYWGQIARTLVEPALNSLIQAKLYQGEADTASATQKINAVLTELDSFIDNKEFIVGAYSYADVHWTAIAHLLTLVEEDAGLTSHSNVQRWFDNVKGRASYASLPTLDDIKQKQIRAVA